MRQRGFTLIELVIVLVIIGIASGLIGLYIGSNKLELRTFVKEMAATLRYARNHAVSEKKTYCFVIDRDERMYRLYGDNKEDEDVVPVISRPIPEGVELNLTTAADDVYQVEFFPQGNTSGAEIEISDGGRMLLIMVNRISGKVEMSREQ